jgi:hypothetical protein
VIEAIPQGQRHFRTTHGVTPHAFVKEGRRKTERTLDSWNYDQPELGWNRPLCITGARGVTRTIHIRSAGLGGGRRARYSEYRVAKNALTLVIPMAPPRVIYLFRTPSGLDVRSGIRSRYQFVDLPMDSYFSTIPLAQSTRTPAFITRLSHPTSEVMSYLPELVFTLRAFAATYV